MRDIVKRLKRNMLTRNPLTVSALGLAGAVVFSRSFMSALTATVSEAVVIAFAATAMFIFERAAGKPGERVVFFASAAAATAVCGLLTARLLPSVWSETGAFFPLLAAGSIALVSSGEDGETLGDRLIGASFRFLGFGVALLAVTLVRLIISAAGINDMEQNGLIFMTVGVLAACVCAVCRALGEESEPEVYGAADDDVEDADIGFDEDIFADDVSDQSDTITESFSLETFPDHTDGMSGFAGSDPITELFDGAEADGDDAIDELLDPDGDTDVDPDEHTEGGDEE